MTPDSLMVMGDTFSFMNGVKALANRQFFGWEFNRRDAMDAESSSRLGREYREQQTYEKEIAAAKR